MLALVQPPHFLAGASAVAAGVACGRARRKVSRRSYQSGLQIVVEQDAFRFRESSDECRLVRLINARQRAKFLPVTLAFVAPAHDDTGLRWLRASNYATCPIVTHGDRANIETSVTKSWERANAFKDWTRRRVHLSRLEPRTRRLRRCETTTRDVIPHNSFIT